jgi:hypothetical protein
VRLLAGAVGQQALEALELRGVQGLQARAGCLREVVVRLLEQVHGEGQPDHGGPHLVQRLLVADEGGLDLLGVAADLLEETGGAGQGRAPPVVQHRRPDDQRQLDQGHGHDQPRPGRGRHDEVDQHHQREQRGHHDHAVLDGQPPPNGPGDPHHPHRCAASPHRWIVLVRVVPVLHTSPSSVGP